MKIVMPVVAIFVLVSLPIFAVGEGGSECSSMPGRRTEISDPFARPDAQSVDKQPEELNSLLANLPKRSPRRTKTPPRSKSPVKKKPTLQEFALQGVDELCVVTQKELDQAQVLFKEVVEKFDFISTKDKKFDFYKKKYEKLEVDIEKKKTIVAYLNAVRPHLTAANDAKVRNLTAANDAKVRIVLKKLEHPNAIEKADVDDLMQADIDAL